MPETNLGQGPRVRGYQFKSQGGGEAKKNPKAYGRLEEKLPGAGLTDAEERGSVAGEGAVVAQMEKTGFVEKKAEREKE